MQSLDVLWNMVLGMIQKRMESLVVAIRATLQTLLNFPIFLLSCRTFHYVDFGLTRCNPRSVISSSFVRTRYNKAHTLFSEPHFRRVFTTDWPSCGFPSQAMKWQLDWFNNAIDKSDSRSAFFTGISKTIAHYMSRRHIVQWLAWVAWASEGVERGGQGPP